MAINKKIATAIVVVLLVLAGIILLKKNGTHLVTSASPSNNPSSNFTFVEASDGVLTDGFLSLGLSGATGGVEGTGNLTERVSTGSCATGTTTLFSIAPPFISAASSTAMLVLRTTGQATSSDLKVGTTTLSSGLTVSNVSSSLASTTIATTSPVYILSGLNGASAQTPAGATTTQFIAVGPSERVGAFASSTFGNAGALNYTGGLTSCTYTILWMR